MTIELYFEQLRNRLETAGDPERAQGQMWYMRHQFEYFGLRAPEWLAIAKDHFKQFAIPEGEQLKAFVRLCYQDDHREMQYIAIEAMERSMKKLDAPWIEFLEQLILEKSWWDSVDWLAKLVGMHFVRHPELIRPVTSRWMDSGERWLQRVAIIFQLRYKEKTDAELMFEYILLVADSKEFFLQKGAGWALRQYSKTNPDAVREFVAAH
ncbi:MAG: DNA alkylation repair protein, partial [Saprospiraceae bacterium]